MTAKRWGAPLAAAIVVALVATLAVWLARGSSTSARPTVLHLGSAAGGTSAMAAAISTEQQPSQPTDTGQEPYKLVGTLPDGQPADAPVYRLPEPTVDDAVTVARALHLDGTPTRVDGGWVLRNGNNRLAVRDDGTWSYGLDCFSGPEAQEELTVECAYASSGGVAVAAPDGATPSPAPTHSVPAGPSDETARATAERLMAALGYTDAEITVNAGDPTSYVEATPHVDGEPAYGWTTGLAVTADGSIDNANGWIGSPQRGASYPLITAQAAFDLLQQQPRPMMEMCMVRHDGEPGCAPIPPSEVTGAALGLAMDYESEKPILVPAWLFTVKDQAMPVSQIAVAPQYIARPSPEPVPPTTKGIPVEPPNSVAPASAAPASASPASAP